MIEHKSIIIFPEKIFKDEEGAIEPYNPDMRPVYDLYKGGGMKPKTVYVLINAPTTEKTATKETIIEPFDMGAEKGIRAIHMALTMPSDGAKDPWKSIHLRLSQDEATIKEGILGMLWKSSPFNLIKCLLRVEEEIKRLGFIHTLLLPEIFNLKEISTRITKKDFLEQYAQIIK